MPMINPQHRFGIILCFRMAQTPGATVPFPSTALCTLAKGVCRPCLSGIPPIGTARDAWLVNKCDSKPHAPLNPTKSYRLPLDFTPQQLSRAPTTSNTLPPPIHDKHLRGSAHLTMLRRASPRKISIVC